MMVAIREIGPSTFDEAALLELLRDAVDAGASVGYLAPLPEEDGRAFWRAVRAALGDGRVLLGAYVEDRLVGSVQLDPLAKPNGRHRAEVQKLLVLGTVPGQPAEKLYERLGYRRAGSFRTMRRNRAADLNRP
ncbi:MAG TPA: hypothetical protein VE085_04590 [Burkholderiales bacterium]|nr:hypothetical protein [Burkholderiales bacterium]